MRDNIKFVAELVEKAAKIFGSLFVLLGILAFAVPYIETGIKLLVSWRFGAVGYVYYEVDKSFKLTDDGNLYLLDDDAAGMFDDIGMGDIMQAGGYTAFRLKDSPSSRQIFVLRPGECAIVLSPERKVDVKDAGVLTGGWLWVATTSCGLFE